MHKVSDVLQKLATDQFEAFNVKHLIAETFAKNEADIAQLMVTNNAPKTTRKGRQNEMIEVRDYKNKEVLSIF